MDIWLEIITSSLWTWKVKPEEYFCRYCRVQHCSSLSLYVYFSYTWPFCITSSSRTHLSYKLSVRYCIISIAAFWGKSKNICPPLPDCQITAKYRSLNSGKNTNPKTEIKMRNIYALFSSTGKILYISKALGIFYWRGGGAFRRALHTLMWQLVTLVAVTLTFFFVIVASNVWNLCLTKPSLHIYFDCISPTHLNSLLLFNFLWKDTSKEVLNREGFDLEDLI